MSKSNARTSRHGGPELNLSHKAKVVAAVILFTAGGIWAALGAWQVAHAIVEAAAR